LNVFCSLLTAIYDTSWAFAIRLKLISPHTLNKYLFRDRLKIIASWALELLRPSQPNTTFLTDICVCVEWRLCDSTHKGLQRQYGRSTEGGCSAREEGGNTISAIESFWIIRSELLDNYL
jgi:hypothetical protein